MQLLDPSLIAFLTPRQVEFLQYIVFALGIATLLYGYFKKQAPPPATAKDMVLTAAGIMDMNPVRDLVASVDRMADSIEAIHVILKEQADTEAMDREINRRVKEQVGRETPRPRSER